jgi:DNA invertase Pin-like site-specific DNA recombinase
VLIVYSLSRMSRSVSAIVARLEKAGAGFQSLTEGIDTTTAALAHKRAKGERVGTVPYGWNDDGGTLIEVPEEQAILARIKACREAGLTYRKIAADLTSEGVVTKKGLPVWDHSTIRSILARAKAMAA